WPADFRPVAVVRDGPATFRASDGAEGLVHVLARGAGLAPIGCGDSVVRGEEECDDGGRAPGDGCGADCRWELDADCRCLDRDRDGWPALHGDCSGVALGEAESADCSSINDCDDRNPLVHPFAREIPGNGVADGCAGAMACATADSPHPKALVILAISPLAGLLALRGARLRRRHVDRSRCNSV
ncbi:MAG: hypothetical protein KC466_18180, partial [Myxococcales bacterium]|nr:hypothetical protein [Myxococcales bacterium]